MTTKDSILIIDPSDSSSLQTIMLDENNKSWITIGHASEELSTYAKNNFDELFDLRPKEKSQVIMYSKECNAHRYYKSYLNTPKLILKH